MTDVLSQDQVIPQYDNNHYAVVDLGSNSFHLLITRLTNSSTNPTLITANKVKQKVRLAAGLDTDLNLTDEAITRGLNCLKLFAKHLATIPVENIIIVATAALRIAKNNDIFFQSANDILPKSIKLLSGEQEASTIYAGVAHSSVQATQVVSNKQLVIDIGGASTEMIVGEGNKAKKLVSLDIGCVSFLGKYFPDNRLTQENFANCIAAATQAIDSVSADFIQLGWHSAVGSSGTMQAMVEILSERNEAKVMTLDFLNDVQQRLINSQSIEHIDIAGLREDRKAVLASGLSILIALFTSLQIKEMRLSSGALREGLLFELLPEADIKL